MAAILLLFRVPFLLTHAVQEDAYITFRSAFHWADLGQYSYNLGDHNPAVTSALYGPVVAFLRLLFHSHAIAAVLVFDSCASILAAYLLACAFASPGRRRMALWMAFGLTPEAMLLSHCGMETALLAAAVAGMLCCVLRSHRRAWGLAFCFFLLPLIRPDAIAFAGIGLAALALQRRGRDTATGALAAVSGVVAMLAANRWETGAWVSRTARAKAISYHPGHSPAEVLLRVWQTFVSRSVFVPLETRFLVPVSFAFTLVVFVALGYLYTRHPKRSWGRPGIAALTGCIFLVPLAYAVGGVLFPWYIWVSSWLAQCAVVLAVLEFAGHSQSVTAERNDAPSRGRNLNVRHYAAPCLAVLGALLLLCRWAVSYSIGVQDFHYRADVGRWLRQTASPGDTLYLEPAGYIPFFAGLHTDDEVGLASDRVLTEKQAHPEDWWAAYLRDYRPTWTVQRNDFRHYETYQHQQLNAAQIAWFQKNYCLVREFHYAPDTYADHGWQRHLLAMGTHQDFLVFHLRGTGLNASGQSVACMAGAPISYTGTSE